MADDFQVGVCSGDWWNSARTLNDVGSYGWQNEIEMKARFCEDSVSCNSKVYQDDTHRRRESDSAGVGSGGFSNSTLQMMSYSLSSPTTEWNQALVSRSCGSNFQQESEFDSSHGEKDWTPRSYSDDGEDPSADHFKHINQVFALDQTGLDSRAISSEPKMNCQGLPSNNPIVSASTLLPGLLEAHPQSQQSQYRIMNYSSPMSYHMDVNEISASFPHFTKPSSPKRQYSTNQLLHFSNNTPFWNAQADVRSTISASSQSQFLTSTFKENSNCCNLEAKLNNEVFDSSSGMKKHSEPMYKRPRIETPSSLPSFKVRKEKLGDRITALQQLVSPFGKTDTASVLFEAIEYIKFLHEQLGVLSNPYMKNGAPVKHKQSWNKSRDSEGLKDLISRGLCLVPISSTFPVTNEATADIWTPTFGGSCYR